MTPSEILLLRKLRSNELRAARMAAKICKVELSRTSGLSRWTIDRIERGNDPWIIDTEIIYTDTISLIKTTKAL